MFVFCACKQRKWTSFARVNTSGPAVLAWTPVIQLGSGEHKWFNCTRWKTTDPSVLKRATVISLYLRERGPVHLLLHLNQMYSTCTPVLQLYVNPVDPAVLMWTPVITAVYSWTPWVPVLEYMPVVQLYRTPAVLQSYTQTSRTSAQAGNDQVNADRSPVFFQSIV